jgi:uncharacterized membrane protein YeaQ/YmgE (transglycosylase-associated protein family)
VGHRWPIEIRLRVARLGLICLGIGAVGSVVSVEIAKDVGFQFPRHFLLFVLLGDAYCACFLLWLIRRWKKGSP